MGWGLSSSRRGAGGEAPPPAPPLKGRGDFLVAVALSLLPLAACAPTVTPPRPPVPPPAAAPRIVEGTDFRLSGAIEQGGLAMGIVPAAIRSLSFDGRSIGFAPDGRFLVAFDRDAAPTARIEAIAADGTILRRTLSVAPRQWKIESLPTLPRGTTPTPEFLARRKLELDQIAAARAIDSGSQGWRQRFIWPAKGRISGIFGSQRIYAGEPGAYHAGVDVAQPAGTPIVAPADGVVILAAAAPFSLEGNLLMIDHGMGLNSAFLHLSRIDVKPGQAVKQGQPLGAIGMTGRATGPHLHWAVKWHEARIDPQPLAGPQ
ncbi:M23 family metallopeptidase [Rhizorhabdus dicambivorans]|uniref:Peptidase n=1 Tax=Rhizorhabdus dicambivorans TaxID=1850238 RepID=A0A2A4G1R1_9SPHN|nr:M23 family metallopeptidase [Rhizorhabdus dicambivorans]ATE63441.1 peptidase [Rhizorhabdus dicambivorans]PCE43660.1 peptidase [Rhizorhabdus dicambivorans]